MHTRVGSQAQVLVHVVCVCGLAGDVISRDVELVEAVERLHDGREVLEELELFSRHDDLRHLLLVEELLCLLD